MNYAYIRVSTEKQSVKNQKEEIRNYAKIHKLRNINFTSETISGTKAPENRKLGELINLLQKNDVLIVTELSRLGRSLTMIFSVMSKLKSRGVRVIGIKNGYDSTLNKYAAETLEFAFGLSAEIERDLISERTKMGLAIVKKNGKHIGRPYGSKNKKHKLSGKGKYIKNKLNSGVSISKIARDCNVSRTTLIRYMKKYKLSKTITQEHWY